MRISRIGKVEGRSAIQYESGVLNLKEGDSQYRVHIRGFERDGELIKRKGFFIPFINEKKVQVPEDQLSINGQNSVAH